MEIHKTIVLSTGHLPEKEFEALQYDLEMPYRWINHDYGCILVISCEQYGYENLSENLKKIIEYCQEHDIRYIDFDEDGPEEPYFPVFEW